MIWFFVNLIKFVGLLLVRAGFFLYSLEFRSFSLSLEFPFKVSLQRKTFSESPPAANRCSQQANFASAKNRAPSGPTWETPQWSVAIIYRCVSASWKCFYRLALAGSFRLNILSSLEQTLCWTEKDCPAQLICMVTRCSLHYFYQFECSTSR